jgi:hypothetical protein
MSPIDREGYRYLISTTTEYNERLLDRLMLENMRTPVTNTPIGGTEGIEQLQDFWKHAREGFRMTFRMDREGQSDITPNRMLAATQDTTMAAVFDEIYNILGTAQTIETAGETPALTAFGHTLATFRYLGELGTVSIDGIESSSKRLLGYLGRQQTDWQQPLNPESIWYGMRRLERETNLALYKPGSFDRATITPVLRAAHFFAAGASMTQKMRAA